MAENPPMPQQPESGNRSARLARKCAALATILLAMTLATTFAAAEGNEPHWAFRKPARPAPPAVKQRDWTRNPIDAFVLARLEREAIAPSHEAPRETLLRRVTLDLTGLPPTLAEIAAWQADDRPDAYERLVDRLLTSPQYAERWTRVWLDLCHYGDSDGHLTDQLRPVAWRYREWVRQAIAENMPYDRFTHLQLAGDLVPEARSYELLGTGFLRQTLSNREGGADLEEYRVAQVLDRTSMVGAIWLGLSVGCARCHDHKLDPLTQVEFYRLYAFFDAADEVNVDAPLEEELAAWQASRPEYERRRRALLEPTAEQVAALQELWEEKLLYAAAHPGEDHIWDRQWELLGLVWGGGLGEGQLEGTEIVKLARAARTPRQKDDLLDYFLRSGSIIDSARFGELKLGELAAQLAALRKEFPQATRAPVMRSAVNARATRVHERGDFRDSGEPVEPGVPACLPRLDRRAAPDRLALARWLTADDHPLTARVAVNRMWQEFFGRGIVATSDDFGMAGDPPSHPELLDWLAREFIESGWNVQHMHRLMATSATYQQSSRVRPQLTSRDPDNLLLARQASLRVPAEFVRDMALSASGLLSRRVGGPCVRPPQNERVTMEAFGSNPWQASEGADRYRRGLYTLTLRTSPFAQATIFDAPSPQEVCTRRERSNTPLQSLTLLNDPVFLELSLALAVRALREAGAGDRERIEWCYLACLARRPTPAEQDRLLGYLAAQRAELSHDSLAVAAIAPSPPSNRSKRPSGPIWPALC
jgi:Protein of unknown function (DUF1553)/Protein of unknown function (DUF1549)